MALRGGLTTRSLTSFVSSLVFGTTAGSALAPAVLPDRVLRRVLMPMDAVRLPRVHSREASATEDVVPPGDGFQMIGDVRVGGGSDAQRVLAKMIDVETRPDGTVCPNPCSTMRVTRGSLGGSLVTELAVTGVEGRGRPLPARPKLRTLGRYGSVLGHLLPESLLRGRPGREIVRSGATFPLIVHRTDRQVSVSIPGATGKGATHAEQYTPRAGVVDVLDSTSGRM